MEQSQETISLDDDDDSAPPDSVRSNTATASPESTPSSANSRRGLRARTATQQRPYSQDARMFEEQLLVDPEPEGVAKRSPKPKPTKLAQVSYLESEPETLGPKPEPEDEDEDNDEMLLDHENGTIAVEAEEPTYSGRRAHYKGKGRAWKKTSEDEDEDYRSPLKVKGMNQPKRKLGRRKSVPISENTIPGGDELNMEEEHAAIEVVAEVKKEAGVRGTGSKVEKQKRKPRKSHTLSEEFVRDDSDSEIVEQNEQNPQPEQKPAIASPAHKILKLKIRNRKSDESPPSKGTTAIDDHSEHSTPSGKKTTPTSQPKKMRVSIVSRNSSPEGHGAAENGEMEQDVALLSPLRKPRKRKSAGSDEGLD
jgi:hypothetical protein